MKIGISLPYKVNNLVSSILSRINSKLSDLDLILKLLFSRNHIIGLGFKNLKYVVDLVRDLNIFSITIKLMAIYYISKAFYFITRV